jgi:hypothetical protein
MLKKNRPSRATIMFDFETRMLSGEPFTIEGLKREYSRTDELARRIELRLRQFQRDGMIEFKRHGLRIIWVATAAGMRKLEDEERISARQ